MLDSARARWEVAALMNRILRHAGSSIGVVSTAGGWMVRTGTGRDTIADSVSQIWHSGLSCSVDSDAVQEILVRAATPVSEALWSAYLEFKESSEPRAGR